MYFREEVFPWFFYLVNWDAIFLVSQEVYLNFHHSVGKIVGGVGGEGIYRN